MPPNPLVGGWVQELVGMMECPYIATPLFDLLTRLKLCVGGCGHCAVDDMG